MSETVTLRVRRMLSSRLEDTINAMERPHNEGVVLAAIRDVERAIEELCTAQEKVVARRLHAVRQQALIADRVEKLTEKARFALQEGDEDLAMNTLAHQVDLEDQSVQLDQVQITAREEEARMAEDLAALYDRKEQLAELAATYAQVFRTAVPGSTWLEAGNVAEMDIFDRNAVVSARLAALKQEASRAA